MWTFDHAPNTLCTSTVTVYLLPLYTNHQWTYLGDNTSLLYGNVLYTVYKNNIHEYHRVSGA